MVKLLDEFDSLSEDVMHVWSRLWILCLLHESRMMLYLLNHKDVNV